MSGRNRAGGNGRRALAAFVVGLTAMAAGPVSAGTDQTFAAIASDDHSRAHEGPPNSSGLTNEGAGSYTDASVANQLSAFTINRKMVSCGVGTITAGEWSGPFAMLMYATKIRTYQVDARTKTIKATGRMRSITQVGGDLVEDVRHRFVAVAEDHGTATGMLRNEAADHRAESDRFDIHLKTSFWNQSNPMCTPSSIFPGGCRFGGGLLLGDIKVDA